jgi:hypothetical protein
MASSTAASHLVPKLLCFAPFLLIAPDTALGGQVEA